MIERPIPAVMAVGCLVAAVLWGRSATRLRRAWRRLDDGTSPEAADLSRSAFRKEAHTTALYLVLAVVLGALGTSWRRELDGLYALLLAPVAVSVVYGRRFLQEARLFEHRAHLEKRAQEVLEQTELAPRRWAARLAPEELPAIQGFSVGRVYEAGTGLMAGDFYDLYQTGGDRLAAVIGDVSGHGIDASITAFQVKYLLRVFLRQYRDPAQALEELNSVMSAMGASDEFVSLCVIVFDQQAGTMRYASAGHPPAWLWHDGEVRPLGATGPLLRLDPDAGYHSRELTLHRDDLVLLYTDGLSEARSGEQLFGEDRIAAAVRRDPGVDVDVLCKSLLEAARDFASAPLRDDVAILAIRRV